MPDSAVILVDYDNVRLIRDERTSGDVASNLTPTIVAREPPWTPIAMRWPIASGGDRPTRRATLSLTPWRRGASPPSC